MSSNNACVHTAGPWTVDDGEITASGFVLGLVYGTDDYPCSEDDITDECQANARLIAAAPELLEACGALLDAAGIDNDTILTGSDEAEFYVGNGTRLPLGVITAIRLAIRKATGGQP